MDWTNTTGHSLKNGQISNHGYYQTTTHCVTAQQMTKLNCFLFVQFHIFLLNNSKGYYVLSMNSDSQHTVHDLKWYLRYINIPYHRFCYHWNWMSASRILSHLAAANEYSIMCNLFAARMSHTGRQKELDWTRCLSWLSLQYHLSVHSRSSDRLCGLVVRVPGYRSRGPGFDLRPYQIF
jgi:hypothetical protein